MERLRMLHKLLSSGLQLTVQILLTRLRRVTTRRYASRSQISGSVCELV